MPLPRPDTTESVASAVIAAMSPISSAVLGSTTSRYPSPAAIWSTPNPSDVATPKTVPMIATTSMTSPRRPFTRSPNSGSSAHRIETGRPLRWIAYASARPATT